MANKIKIKRGLKAGLPNLEVGELGLATDTDEVFIGTPTGNKLVNVDTTNPANITQSATYRFVTDTEKSIWNEKQNKLTAGENITIVDNVISATSGEGLDLDKLPYMDKAASIYYKANKNSLFKNAWGHSLEVDISEIEKDGDWSNKYGTLQYPDGETFGVIIPNSVTSIGSYAFSGWKSNNQPLVIPNSVTSIGGKAFQDWSSNNQPLVIPNSVTSIGAEAFYNWKSNNQLLVIPNSVTSIGSRAFYYWTSNNQPLVIPNSVISISPYSFREWTSNNQPLVIPNSVTSIGEYAFYGWYANNQPLVIPDSVTSVDYSAFGSWRSNNQPLVIPNSVTSIGDYAFLSWTYNKQPLIISNSVTSIGGSAFREWASNTHPLVIPDSVTSIGREAFGEWGKVPYVEIKAVIPPSLGASNAFGSQNNAPIYVPDASVNDYKTATNWVSLADRIKPISELYGNDFVKLNETNTFTKPQVVPDATANNEVVNLGQLNAVVGNIESALDSILGV